MLRVKHTSSSLELQLVALPVHVLPLRLAAFAIFAALLRRHLLLVARLSSLSERLFHLHPASAFFESLKKPKFDFKVSLLEPLACLVNQTLFCLVSQSGWLAGWLQ